MKNKKEKQEKRKRESGKEGKRVNEECGSRWVRKPCAPKCDTPPLTPQAKRVVMSELPPSPKNFSDFLVFFLEMKFRWKKFAVFWKICENLFFTRKKSDLKLKIGGIFGKKKFFKSFETSVIISLKKDNLPYLAVFRKKNSIGKHSNFKFQNRGYFEKMRQNPNG